MHSTQYRVVFLEGGKKKITFTDDEGREKFLAEIAAGFEEQERFRAPELLKSVIPFQAPGKTICVDPVPARDNLPPLLALVPENGRLERLPLVLLAHGFESSKEKMLRYGIRFAAAGFFTVLMDAPLHGERYEAAEFRKRFEFGPDPRRSWVNRLEIMGVFLEEVLRLIKHYVGDPRVDPDKIGVAGISMGGTVSLLAAAKDPRVKAAVAFVPVVDFESANPVIKQMKIPPAVLGTIRALDPVHVIQKAPEGAILIQCGAEDGIVGVEGARNLDAVLRDYYSGNPGKYRYVEYAGVGHDVTLPMADDAVKWMREQLGAVGQE